MARVVTPRRGDVYWVNLDPTVGSEIRKRRPAVIVSNDAANRRYHQVTVVPLTSQKTTVVEFFQIFVAAEESGLTKDSKALTEQVRTLSKLRLGPRAGHLSDEIMEKMNEALKIHLDLS